MYGGNRTEHQATVRASKNSTGKPLGNGLNLDTEANEFAIARELIAARVRAGLTQEEITTRMHTAQSTIARLESGRTMPSMRTLQHKGYPHNL